MGGRKEGKIPLVILDVVPHLVIAGARDAGDPLGCFIVKAISHWLVEAMRPATIGIRNRHHGVRASLGQPGSHFVHLCAYRLDGPRVGIALTPNAVPDAIM